MATIKKRPQTPNRGAADVVQSGIRKVKRMKAGANKDSVVGHGYIIACDDFIAWLSDWDKRAAAKRGGLGKK